MPRVLIVDDSPTARRILADILSQDNELEVAGFAGNGREAIARTRELKPDVITMDLNMPVMDGFEATREIMIIAPTPIIIVSATARASEVETAMEALRVGALNLLLKPVGPQCAEFTKRAREIINTVKAMAEVTVMRRRRRAAGDVPAPKSLAMRTTAAGERTGDAGRAMPSERPFGPLKRVIVIAASTGGPPALANILGHLPRDFPLPILLVQHIARGFMEGFVKWLDHVVPMHVQLAVDGLKIEPGCVYVAPQDRHLGLRGNRIRLADTPPICGFRPAGNHLFCKAAEACGSGTVGVLLTGMGDDGVEGLRQIHVRGGQTIAQDQATCAVYGMPKAAVEAGVVDLVLPLPAIGKHLCDLAATSARK